MSLGYKYVCTIWVLHGEIDFVLVYAKESRRSAKVCYRLLELMREGRNTVVSTTKDLPVTKLHTTR